jgi:thiol-disulfide isomerase/thioredoxin
MSRSLLIACLSVLILAGCDRAGEDTAQPGAYIDDRAAGTLLPELVLIDPAGAQLDLSAVEGPVLINLWATWCAPCVIEMPLLDRLAGEFEGELQVITISQDMRGAEVVAPFFAAREFAYLQPWLDPETRLSAQFSETGLLPLTILFDASGREVWRVVGAYEWDSEEAIAAVRAGIES